MGIRVLLVEDDESIADSLGRGLREEGFRVSHAADGPSAWAELTASSGWDLVILDWWLPGEDGLSLLRRFRARDRTTPVLFLTARDTLPDRVRGLDSGADDYLVKPFAFEELLARCRALLRRSEARTDTVVSSHGVTIDMASQKAARDGQPLDLKAREYALLLFFLRHPEQVLSRTRIYEHVWDERYDGLSNTLEVHVMELRRKLEAGGGPRLIQTLRNRGYRFGSEPGPVS
jgi:DNA-binding response OmpR family regulator